MGVLRQPLFTADPADAGGAYVRRAFDFKGEKLASGSKLTREDIESIPSANLQSLVNTGYIQLFPAAPSSHPQKGERFIVSAEDGKFHVVEGHLVTKTPVTKQHAQKLAAKA